MTITRDSKWKRRGGDRVVVVVRTDGVKVWFRTPQEGSDLMVMEIVAFLRRYDKTSYHAEPKSVWSVS